MKRSRTESELLPGRVHVDAKGQLELVVLEVQPPLEGSEGRHGSDVGVSRVPSLSCGHARDGKFCHVVGCFWLLMSVLCWNIVVD